MLTEEEYYVGMSIVKYVIKRNRARLGNYGIDDDEAFSAGLVGLAESINDYDEATCRVDWFTFTYQHIWASIFGNDNASTKSVRRIKMDSAINRIRDLYFQKTGWQLTDEKLAYLLDANELFPKIIRDHFRETKTLPYAIKDDGEHRGVPLTDSRIPLPEDEAGTKDFVEVVQSILNNRDDKDGVDCLNDEEEFVIRLRFGIASPVVIMKEISRLSGLSTNTVGRRLISGLEKLKNNSRLKALQLDLVEA